MPLSVSTNSMYGIIMLLLYVTIILCHDFVPKTLKNKKPRDLKISAFILCYATFSNQ